MEHADAVVIGTGFGGLGAALALAEQGARVVVRERLTYPGGCASTFSRGGARYEAGATLFVGFGPGQPMARWIDRHRLDVSVDFLDPVVRLRTPSGSLDVPADRAAFVDRLGALPGAPVTGLRGFFADQQRMSDALWPLFDDPDLLPPLTLRSVGRHLPRAATWLRHVRWVGRPILDLARRHGVADFAPFRVWLDAACQITVQVPAAEAETLFAAAAIDLFFRGAAHVRGGVGRLAAGLCGAVEDLGGSVRFADRATAVRRDGDAWVVDGRRGPVRAPLVIGNLLPSALGDLLGEPVLPGLDREVRSGWGAAMLYRLVPHDALPPEATHFQVVADPSRPPLEGNHVFCSVSAVSDRLAPAGLRSVTASTHVRMDGRADAVAARIAAVHDRMRQTLAVVPELAPAQEMTASPRTFERFTGRPGGFVGGIPRRAGLRVWTGLLRGAVRPGLYLVGDSVFPGQSTLATALGGYRLGRHTAPRDLGADRVTAPRARPAALGRG